MGAGVKLNPHAYAASIYPRVIYSALGKRYFILYLPGWPEILYVYQAGFKLLRDPPALPPELWD